MRGFINIVIAVFVCVCVGACKARIHTHTEEDVSTFESFGSVSKVVATGTAQNWLVSSFMADAKSGSWKKIKIYDTSLQDSPLVMEIEQHDSVDTSSTIHINDSSKVINNSVSSDIKSNINSSDIKIEEDRETESEERMSDMMSRFILIWILAIVIFGFYVIYKKIG